MRNDLNPISLEIDKFLVKFGLATTTSLLLVLLSCTNAFAQLPTIDGNLCPGNEWGQSNASDGCNDANPPTADMGNSYLIANGDELYIGWQRCSNGSGTSQYTLRFDVDCDGMIDGAVYVLWGAIGSACTDPIEVILEGLGSGNTQVIGGGFQGSPNCIGNNCPNAGNFMEFIVDIRLIVDLFVEWGDIDPCKCDCTNFELIDAVTLAGGSLTSSAKDEFTTFDFNYQTEVNECPQALFEHDQTVCQFELVSFDGTLSTDLGPLPQDDVLDHTWDFGDGTSSTGQTVTHTYTSPGLYDVKMIVSDYYGCTSEYSSVIRVVPDSPPVMLGCPADLILECGTDYNTLIDTWIADAELSILTNSTDDRPGSLTIENNFTTYPSAICNPSYSLEISFTITDDCGNQESCSAFIYQEDTTDPEVICPTDVTLQLDANCEFDSDPIFTFSPTVSDECDDLIIEYEDNFTGLTECSGTGTIIRTWTVTDVCGGNVSTCTQNIDIEDVTPPSIVCPNDITVNLDESCGFSLDPNETGEPTVSDNCGVDVVDYSDDATMLTECSGTGIIIRTWTVMDNCGLTAKCEQRIIIIDDTPPLITVEASDLLEECDLIDTPLALNNWLAQNGGAEATDNCVSLTWSYEIVDSSDDCSITAFYDVLFTVTDDCGNTATSFASFTVEDNVAPQIDILPTDLTVNCNGSGNIVAYDNWINNNGGATASDSCGDLVWSHTVDSVIDQCSESATTIVTFIVTDECLNSSSAQANFIIIDTTVPSFINEAEDLLIECGTDNTSTLITTWLNNNGNAIAIDECSGSNLTWENNYNTGSENNDCGASGSIDVIFTVTDECGNSSTTTGTLEISDLTPPTIDITAANEVVECDGLGNQAELDAWLANNGGASASDDCGDVMWSNDFTNLSDDCGETGSALVVFTATDVCGNSTTTEATFTIQDSARPVIDCALFGGLQLDCGTENDQAINDWIAQSEATLLANANDECGLFVISNNYDGVPPPAVCQSNFTGTFGKVVSFYVTDNCGNVTTCRKRIKIIDRINPSIDTEAEDLKLRM